jgi:uncharacterized repeat protein (TIGR04076 family)
VTRGEDDDMARERPKVRITVLQTLRNKELYDRYAVELSPRCPKLKEGQQFVSEDLWMPEGFCDWAWSDIHRDVAVLCAGGSYPWMREKGVAVACCTDAFRPVVFLLEKLEG